MIDQNLTAEKILNELLIGNELSNILNNPKEFPSELMEILSIIVALKFFKNEISYSDGDQIMNSVWGFWVTNDHYIENYPIPENVYECYGAFDAGEYYRTEDDATINPIEKYTRPLIEEFLKKLNKI
ncbi:hypothetical protein [Pedobacter helvus]|uniref:Uncharacterized protein n=1 Tax=Pedobacter helvus TaxID=2563444 RepID=A0ABW9JK75_9SPHI|nr:hypothetical protein [Pedobacter ureilyticus]